MEIERFVKEFAEQFIETDADAITTETVFREIPEWSSLIALSIIAMVDTEYGIKLKGNDLRVAKTVQDVYDIVKSRGE